MYIQSIWPTNISKLVGCAYLTNHNKLTVQSFFFEKLKCAEITFDREYSNKKSKTVIYLVSTPDNNLNMDLEIDGQQRENIKSVRDDPSGSRGSNFKVAVEQGDTATCKQSNADKIKLKHEDDKLAEEYKEAIEKYNERVTFMNDDEIAGKKKTEETDDSKATLGELSIHDVWEKIPLKQAQSFEERDQVAALMEQIQKMKLGMERLQEIAQQFNCSKQFQDDVAFLTKNVGAALEKSEAKENYLETKL